ncbi:non-homologous end-joining factor 1 isoform X2 [Diachasma alloeum]|uniref:non-homologous end-joining factor 1 isoform X2 n=1 Tax=Diachasma alloeum TaxID=454923 RepID=UPI000738174D|nr:non-homologous end-joining factor 1 isoform X2 [Diachasma alloeum]
MWKEIHSGQEVFMVSSELIGDKWKILLTNLIELWAEDISREEVVDKCQRLNPLLSIEDVDIDEIIAGILSNIPQLAVEVTKRKIKLETTVEGGVFRYEMDLVKSTPQELWREVTMPLCLSVEDLRRQKEMLIKEMKRKDEEIMEYRANGAELIRKHIQTKPFNEDSIKGNIPVDSPKCCLDIFKSVINTSEVCRAKDKIIKKESLFYNHSQPPVIPNHPPNEENDDSKRRKIDIETKTIVEPEVEVQEMVRNHSPSTSDGRLRRKPLP